MFPIKSILRVTFFEIFLMKSVEFIRGKRTMLLVTAAYKYIAHLLDIVGWLSL